MMKHIEYEVELIDPLTGVAPVFPGVKLDRQFEVKFNDSVILMLRELSSLRSEKRIINKDRGEVLYMMVHKKDSSFFFSTVSEMLNMDMSSNYGDTIINITNDRKKILGFDCFKIEMNFGDQATGVFWITESISPGVIIPGTPLANGYLALEYIFEDPDLKEIYKAKKIENISISEESLTIPKEYKLTVPQAEFDVSGLSTRDSSEFLFIHYPEYKKGAEQLHEDIRALCKLKPKVDDPIGDFYNVYISFTVNINGTLSDIKILGLGDQELERVKSLLLSSEFIPAYVRGEKVSASVSVSVNLNEK